MAKRTLQAKANQSLSAAASSHRQPVIEQPLNWEGERGAQRRKGVTDEAGAGRGEDEKLLLLPLQDDMMIKRGLLRS